jgi:capsular exopolysaccharide synthesis family protein
MSDQVPAGSAEGGRLTFSASPEGGQEAGVFAPQPESYRAGEIDVHDIWTTLKRRRWTIGFTMVAVVALVVLWTLWVTPKWSATTLIRVEEQESGLLAAPALTALTGLGGAGSQIETELRILRTRPIAEDVVDRLDLNVVVTDPREVPREALFEALDFGRDTPEDEFEIRPIGDGRYRIVSTDGDTPDFRAEFAPGERVEIPGGSFILADLAAETDRDGSPLPTSVDLQVLRFQQAVRDLFDHLSTSRPDREANVLQVGYRTTDRTLVHDVPNAVAAAFIERRTATNKMDARSTVSFIQAQVDTTRQQLRAVEDSLRAFQEEEQVVAVEAEAEAQIERLATLQTQRTQLDAERAALASLLADIDRDAAHPDYRRLASFPTFFRNQAVASLLSSLIQADSARSALLARATPSHPDVIAVEDRIGELEAQLGSIGRNYLGSLSDQIAALDDELARFGAELETVPDRQITFARIQRQVEMLGELYKTLQTRLKEAQVQEAIDDSSVRVVEQAIEPLRPTSPKPLRNLALALSLGLVLGVVLAFVREYTDRRLHGTDSLETLFGLPTMARIPRGASGGDGRRLIALDDAQSVEAESYRTLRTNVGLAQKSRGGHEILVTSPSMGEGKSATAGNLAISLSQKGQRTLLVDADMRRPTQHEKFGVSREPGLSDILLGEAELETVLRRASGLESLYVLPAGRSIGHPAELLDSARMDALLETLRTRFDAVVLEAPPVLAVTDAAVLAPKTDGVILVLRTEKTDKEAIAMAIQQLRQVDAELLGAVVHGASAEGSYQSSYREYVGDDEPTGLRGLLDRIRSGN